MSYEVWFTEPAKKELSKLDHVIQDHIIAVLERIRIRPDAYVTKLVGDSRFKLRAGDYRVLLEIDRAQERILVHRIRHRKNVYDF